MYTYITYNLLPLLVIGLEGVKIWPDDILSYYANRVAITQNTTLITNLYNIILG